MILEKLLGLWQNTPELIRGGAVAAVSALFGAWLSGRATARRAIIDELRALSAAHALCVIIANKALALKGQYIRDIESAYNALYQAHVSYMTNSTGPFDAKMDLRTLSIVTFPSAHLEKLVCEKLSLGGEGVATAISLSGATNDLRESLKFRNDLVNEFREQSGQDVEKQIAKYLGLVDGHAVDDRFRSNIESLRFQTDDCIFFAKRLGAFILVFENKIRCRNWHYLLSGKKLMVPDWTLAENAGLLPSEADYVNWTRGFVRRPSPIEKWFSTIKRRFQFD
jgi:hypothetical protein